MNPLISTLVSTILAFVAHLPRSAVAKVARVVLADLAVRIEGVTTSTIVHEAETVTFAELDTILAQIQAANV